MLPERALTIGIIVVTLLLTALWSQFVYLYVSIPLLDQQKPDQDTIIFLTIILLLIGFVFFLGVRFVLSHYVGDDVTAAGFASVWSTSALLVLCLVTSFEMYSEQEHRIFKNRLQANSIAAQHAHRVEELIEQSESSTATLAYLVRATDGNFANFEQVAADLLRFAPGITNLQLAEGGKVSHIYPLAGHEKAIGHDLLKDDARNYEAILARRTGQLTLAGPFKLVQGGFAVVARRPVFFAPNETGFWGFISALIMVEDIIRYAELEEMQRSGFRWQLYRMQPEQKQRQIIAGSQQPTQGKPLSVSIQVPNGKWQLAIEPEQGWYPAAALNRQRLIAVLLITLIVGLFLNAQIKRLQLKQQLRRKALALDEEKVLLQQTQRVASIGNWKRTLKGKKLLWSPEIYAMLNIDMRQRPSSKLIAERCHPEDWGKLRQCWQSLVQGESYQLEYRVRVDGQYRWFKEYAIKVAGHHRRADKFLGVVEDISEFKRIEIELKEVNTRLELALAGAEMGSWRLDIERQEFFFDQEATKILGLDRNQYLLDRAFIEQHLHPDDVKKVIDLLNRTYHDSTDAVAVDCRFAHATQDKDRDYLWVRFKGRVTEIDAHNRPKVSFGVVENIDYRKRTELKLKVMSTALEDSPVPTLITNTTPRIVFANSAYCRMSGYTFDELKGQNPNIVKSGLTDDSVFESMWKKISNHHNWSGEIINRSKDGALVLTHTSIAPISDDNGQILYYVAIAQDITEQRQKEQSVWRQANFDPLTGLANRQRFEERLKLALNRAQRTGNKVLVIYVDLNDFKPVNDNYGHRAGDFVLRQFADKLGALVRASDTAARVGGDEFVILVEDCETVVDAENTFAKITQRISENRFDLDAACGVGSARRITLRASAGMAIYPDDANSESELVEISDMHMYRNKKHMKNKGRQK